MTEGPKGRADTSSKKRWILDRLWAAWLTMPEQRLGQIVRNALDGACGDGGRTFASELSIIEDNDLVSTIEAFASAAAFVHPSEKNHSAAASPLHPVTIAHRERVFTRALALVEQACEGHDIDAYDPRFCSLMDAVLDRPDGTTLAGLAPAPPACGSCNDTGQRTGHTVMAGDKGPWPCHCEAGKASR